MKDFSDFLVGSSVLLNMSITEAPKDPNQDWAPIVLGAVYTDYPCPESLQSKQSRQMMSWRQKSP